MVSHLRFYRTPQQSPTICSWPFRRKYFGASGQPLCLTHKVGGGCTPEGSCHSSARLLDSAFRATPRGRSIVPHGPKGRHQFGCDSPRITGTIVPGEVLQDQQKEICAVLFCRFQLVGYKTKQKRNYILDVKLEHLTFLFLLDILIYSSMRIANDCLKSFCHFSSAF